MARAAHCARGHVFPGQVLGLGVQVLVVGLGGQDVVGAPGADRGRGVGLGGHRAEGDDGTDDVDDLEQVALA